MMSEGQMAPKNGGKTHPMNYIHFLWNTWQGYIRRSLRLNSCGQWKSTENACCTYVDFVVAGLAGNIGQHTPVMISLQDLRPSWPWTHAWTKMMSTQSNSATTVTDE